MRPYSLVILAAGMASRFGSAKQVCPVGPSGEWLMEYSIYQALLAGYARVVIVIRAELQAEMASRLDPFLKGRAELRFVVQDRNELPDGVKAPEGTKPLGTAHALWCCRRELPGPFCLINADDFYGQEALSLLCRNWDSGGGLAMSAYSLDKTLSAYGGVNRGICTLDEDGCLAGVEEAIDIKATDAGIKGVLLKKPGELLDLQGSQLVSMNCWGLTPELFPELESGLRVFAAQSARKEYYLPEALAEYIMTKGARLKVLRSPDSWIGMTYKEDTDALKESLAAFHEQGLFPSPLWKA